MLTVLIYSSIIWAWCLLFFRRDSQGFRSHIIVRGKLFAYLFSGFLSVMGTLTIVHWVADTHPWLLLFVSCLAMLCAALLATISYLNRQIGLFILALGLGANGLVITLNGGLMPASGNISSQLSVQIAHSSRHVLANDSTLLPWLGDWIHFPYSGGIFSPGDLLLTVGSLIIIWQYFRWRKSLKQEH